MILYFSATGNSKYVAERIAEAIGDAAVSMSEFKDKDSLNIKDDYFGIVAPTYVYGLPKIVEDFLLSCKISFEKENPHLFYISTYGTSPGCTSDFADAFLNKTSGYRFNSFYSIKMVDNFTPMFDLSDKEKVKRINENAVKETTSVINKIKGKSFDEKMRRKMPSFVKPFTKPVYNLMRKTSHFKVEENCIGCGLCERNCVESAIEIKSNKPVWVKKHCQMCLSCLHHCPAFAIQYGKNSKKHGQYLNPCTKI